ncbi:MAG: RNA-binding protein [candidate division Zixibacteria bacterium]|nr:RNA-binding protein [candidate division Zixibacteria bacterium]
MNIFVGNLSRQATEEDLKNAFSAFGNVARATIIKDKFSGEPRGFGFVEMATKEEAQAAIAGMNGKEFLGRTLNVNEARPRENNPRMGGGGGGGDRRPGGGGGGRGGYGGGRRDR